MIDGRRGGLGEINKGLVGGERERTQKDGENSLLERKGMQCNTLCI